jgi:tetratricopeptide (TPR) repeat protein
MPPLSLPPALVTAVQEQRSILFLGAGAVADAPHPKGHHIPLGDALRDMISDRFLGGNLKNRPLTAVSAMAASEVGLIPFQKYIREVFIDFHPADYHLLIPTFRWRAIVTTNFDLIVERAYEKSRGTIQTLVKSWKDGDQFDNRMHEVSDPVGFYKLHGCIDHFSEEAIPLILGQDEYASYATNRSRFYDRLRDLAFDNPIIFCGYGIGDPHIQKFLFDLTDKSTKRPMYYHVDPALNEIEVRYWGSHQVTCVVATTSQFLQELDSKISFNARRLRRELSADRLSLQSHYRTTSAAESDSLRFYVQNDVVHLHSGLVTPRQDAREFYRGYDTGFGCITSGLDISRPITDSVLVDAILLEEAGRKSGEFFLIKGPAGNGKTVTLKRVAWETATSYEQIVLYADGPAGIRFEPLDEIHQLTGKRIFLFVDRVALVRDELLKLLRTCKGRRFPLTVVGAERENEWNIYCEALEPFTLQEFSVGYLSREEVVSLLAKLEEHRALGLLAERTHAERIDAFLNRAESQLLVALHETTLGVPFEKIILDEYSRIRPDDAQRLYLEICALHQFGAPVRAGLISRASGLSFDDFGRHFLKPLADVVLVEEERHTPSDVFYRSRHQHVAELVFNQVLPSDEDKYDLLARLIDAINIDYSSDKETFARLVRGRSVASMFASAELGRLLYDRAETAAKSESFVAHQRAVFELQHRDGSLGAAESAASRAAQLNPASRSIRHTQAEVARRQAIATGDPLLKQSYRRAARDKLSGDAAQLSQYDLHTRAKLAIDELRELITKNTKLTGHTESALLSATKDAETAIQRGRSEFPENAELLAAEADFRDLLNQAPQALAALEHAFKLNPRQDWLAVRLAKRYGEAGNEARAMEVIQRCLQDNPDSKPAHLHAARLLMQSDGPRDGIIEHLRRSFTPGDNNFEGQFWYARELFLANRVSDSRSVFESLSERAPGRFRTDAAAIVARSNGSFVSFDGVVARKEEGYAFIKVFEFAEEVFSSRADSLRIEWDRIRTQSQIACYLAFNRRGPRAIKLTVRRT